MDIALNGAKSRLCIGREGENRRNREMNLEEDGMSWIIVLVRVTLVLMAIAADQCSARLLSALA